MILACHSDTALEILRAGEITDEEHILSQFDWNHIEAVLHSDEKARAFALLLLSQLVSLKFIVDAQEPDGLVMLELPTCSNSYLNETRQYNSKTGSMKTLGGPGI